MRSSPGVRAYHVWPTSRFGPFPTACICNRAIGGIGIVNAGSTSAGGTITTLTSQNFFFNNVLVNASIKSSPAGTENYYSQNTQSAGALTATGAETSFNPSVP